MTLQEDPADVRSAIGRAFALIVAEALGYIVFLLNVPVAFSLILMGLWLIVVAAQVYGWDFAKVLNAWAPFIKGRSIHYEVQGCEPILALYAKASFVVFIFWEIIRSVFRLKRASLRRNLIAGLTVASIGWGLILVHIPFIKLPQNSTRGSMFGVSIAMYVGCVIAYSVGCLITNVADQVIDRVTGRAADA